MIAPPDFFVDRSLGDKILPALLRQAGMVVHPMAEVYGRRVAQTLADEVWIREATANGWALLHKDTAIARRTQGRPGPLLAALIEAGARAFCMMSADLSAQRQVERILRHRARIEQLARETPGPYVFGLYAHGLARIWPAEGAEAPGEG
ncbi:MAG: hypothetical protein ACREQ5_18530 [Candidatus Dormibacteria bacterium]